MENKVTHENMNNLEAQIILISNEAPPRPGGAGMVVEIFNKHKIKCFSASITNRITYLYKLKMFKYFWFLELTFRLIMNKKYIEKKIVILNDFGALLSYWVTKKIFPFYKMDNTIIYIHHGLISEANGKLKATKSYLLKKFLDDLPVSQIAVSDFVRKKLFKQRNVSTLHIPAFLIDYEQVALTSSKNNSDDIIKMFCACRINYKKVPENSLSFLDSVGQKLSKKIKLTIAGSGGKSIITEYKRLNEELSHLDIEFVGHMTRGEVQSAIAETNVVINLSILFEGAPTLGYEAALLNKPYVFLDRGGHIETARFNMSGYVAIPSYEDKYASVVANKLQKILSHKRIFEYTKLPSWNETLSKLIATAREKKND